MGNKEDVSAQELLIEACRSNQADLIRQAYEEVNEDQFAELLNSTTDSVGNHCLHICVMYQSVYTLDCLLDQTGLEVDILTRVDGETPLHLAARFVEEDVDLGYYIIQLLIDAGSDPRLKNKYGLKPRDLLPPEIGYTVGAIREALDNAELGMEIEERLSKGEPSENLNS
ncbi:hypothetical protein BDW71DRAFT_191218 [Aspergillus fruticulosus]